MSHTSVVYSFSDRGLTFGNHPSPVREEDAEYDTFRKSYLDYVDVVDNKLPKAKAIAWLIHEGDIAHEETIKEASLAIVDFIDEVLVAHGQQYETYKQTRDRMADE